MAKLAVKQTPKDTIETVASESLERANGDWSKAASIMRKRIDADDDLFRELMYPLIDRAIWDSITKSAHAIRKTYNVRPNRDNAAGLVAIGNSERLRWLDYPLSKGVRLGDADKDKLLSEAEMHRAFKEANGAKEALWTAIANRLNGNKTVRQVLTEEQLAKIAEKII